MPAALFYPCKLDLYIKTNRMVVQQMEGGRVRKKLGSEKRWGGGGGVTKEDFSFPESQFTGHECNCRSSFSSLGILAWADLIFAGGDDKYICRGSARQMSDTYVGPGVSRVSLAASVTSHWPLQAERVKVVFFYFTFFLVCSFPYLFFCFYCGLAAWRAVHTANP